MFAVKFIYSEKATKICRNLLNVFDVTCSKYNFFWRFRQILVAFSEYMNYDYLLQDTKVKAGKTNHEIAKSNWQVIFFGKKNRSIGA